IDYFGNTIFMMGDPIDNKFSLYTSKDWGESWQELKNSPFSYNGEAGFAASGTNVSMQGQSIYTFVSGGDSSRYFRSNDGGQTWFSKTIGFNSCPTCGAYSFTYTGRNRIIAVGGDYLKPNASDGTCRISKDGGKTWNSPKKNPNGYRSNITLIDGVLYSCGTNGIDYSRNKGKTWYSFATGNYFTLCKFDGKLAASTVNGTIHLFNLIK
ncbi:MAG: WD40/YVTN/BNR-like repeat-containing protein, partial [Bacteroidota bacterium]